MVRDQSCIRDVAIAWIAGQQGELETITINFVDMSDSSILLEVDDRLIQIIIPSSFHMEGCGASYPLLPSSSDEVFLITTVGSKSDEVLENMLMAVNEKLERVAIQPDALSQVLDHLLIALRRYESSRCGAKGCVASRKLETQSHTVEDDDNDTDADNSDNGDSWGGNDECDAVDSDDNSPDHYGYDLASCDSIGNAGHSTSGFLYAMAENARMQCELARELAGWNVSDLACSDHNSFLRWCIVMPDPKSLTVSLLIHVGGIVKDDGLASALGISLDSPVKIPLLFDKNLWVQKECKPIKPSEDACKVTQELPMPSKSSEEELHYTRSHSYGTGVLLPKLVRAYFQFLGNVTVVLEEKPKNQDLFAELHQFTSIENTFIGLLCFLCARFRALQDWCVVCWNSLPYSVCRLRTCDRELCLFTFEELGVGTRILHEVQITPEIIDFELSLAIVATLSHRDVFEPFPTFLLERDEIRGRSGWFSKAERLNSANTPQMAAHMSSHSLERKDWSNKNLTLLTSILQSYPPLTVMKECRDEVTLRDTLNKFWDKKLEAVKVGMKGKRLKDQEVNPTWDKLKCLPYSVLRYVLSTSRLKLHLLEASEQFETFNSHYQFVVLHDNPEKEAYFESRRVQQKGSFFAFHGSAAENWYSILRNGLRALSNTSFMSSGASYGSGIYLGSQFGVSQPFCVPKGPGWAHGILEESVCVLAICEIINGSIRGEGVVSNTSLWSRAHASTRGIMVVPPEHEKDVAIRYILVLKVPHCNAVVSINGTTMTTTTLTGTTSMQNIDLMHHYQALRSAYSMQQEEQRMTRSVERLQFMLALSQQMKQREDEPKEASHANADKNVDARKDETRPEVVSSNRKMGACTSAMQAIAREYKNIMRQTTQAKAGRSCSLDEDLPILAGVEVILPDENNICRWHVNLSHHLFKNFPLYKDLVECARQCNMPEASIKLECTFPETYPFSPPFVRVVSPKFSFHTGHVTVGGSICMELLTESGWSPVYTFESTIVQIVNAMIEGGGRLDKRAFVMRSEYNELEAREAFNRVARDHGWNK